MGTYSGKSIKLFSLAVLLGGLLSVSSALAVNQVSFISHQIHINLNVAEHSAKISDNGSMQLSDGYNLFYLPENAEVAKFFIGAETPDHIIFNNNDTAGIEKFIGGSLSEITTAGSPRILAFKADRTGEATFEIEYSAVFHQDVSKARFSRENVGREVTGTIGEQGAYLSPSSYYYPMGQEEGAYFKLSVSLPLDWEAVSDGNRISDEIKADRKHQSFENPFISDGNMFMAAPYVVGIDSIDNIEIACLFFAEDSSLIPDYLESTVGYIKMYAELIGPYPYNRFTVAENFFPTGYGMPAWTLLGQQVIRLPFIKATSLGHEVLHNWWGNSVYVDYDRGNWCESATVYGADYRYKLLQSPEAAKTYRKNILKEYTSYVREANDFPIREFKGRTSANTRTIGYNKAMMVWHMIEEEIGSEPFWSAWKIVNERYITKKISWEEWLAVFEETSGKSLSHIIPQWIDQAGAPEIELVSANQTDVNSSDPTQSGSKIVLKLKQNSTTPYHLNIPVRYEDQAGVHDTVLVMSTSAKTFFLPANKATVVGIDPDHHLFRKLYPEEVEPIVSGVVGAEKHMLVCGSDNAEARRAFAEFGLNLLQDSLPLQYITDISSAEAGIAPIVINPVHLPQYFGELVEVTYDSVKVLETWYPKEGHTFVFSGKNWLNAEKYMVLMTSDFASLPRLGQLVPHYGKYSYLVFEGARNVGKGQWPVTDSPLKINLTAN